MSYLLLGRAVRGNLAVTSVVQNYPIVVQVKNKEGLQRAQRRRLQPFDG
jgi:hypothetical protein